MLYRADLLEQVGLDIPKTYDQLHEVLLAFRDKTDVAVPLGLSSSGFVGGMQGGAALTGGFDVGAPTEEDLGWTVDDDGKVVCSAVSDNMKEFLDMWSTWYSEGLLTKDYINQVSNRSDEITSGQVGVAYNMMTCVSDTEREMYGIQMVTGPDIVKNEGDIIHTGINEHPNSQGSGSIAVSTMCEYPEVACEWLNWFFTEKGRESYNFGIKGETYDIDADGVPYYTDAIMNNELGVGVGLATSMIIGWAAMPFPRYHERTTALYTNDEEKGMYDMWVENRDNTHVYFGDLTQTESEQFSSVSSDILTYVSTSISEFIMGDRPMDEWNTYVDQCYSMGIQTLIDLKQAAYDRYCAR
jgi:putative aldouronate transport system substrate-binding protein